MKTLVEIQSMLRKMSEEIAFLSKEMEELKPKEKTNVNEAYSIIERIAKQYPINNTQLSKASESAKKLYIQFLSILANADESNMINQLLLIQRIANGIHFNKNILEIVKSGIIFNDTHINDVVENLSEYKYSLILDSLIIANINGNATDNELNIIADISSMMGCSNEDLKLISKLSLALIQNDRKIFDDISSNECDKWSGQFWHYIPKKWIVENRCFCGEAPHGVIIRIGANPYFDPHPKYQELDKINHKFLINEGKRIVNYKNTKTEEEKDILAKKTGTVFYKEETYIEIHAETKYEKIYIVSCFDDYDDFCKWLAMDKS